MKYRILGKTELKVSVIGLGTHQFSGEWARQYSKTEVREMVTRAREIGINLIDTAECYGNHSVENLIGEAIKPNRSDWILGTKFGHRYDESGQKVDAWSPEEVRKQLEQSLQALETDYIDLYQFHSGSNDDFNNDALWTMLIRQVREGKIRHLGISLNAGLFKSKDFTQLHSALDVNVDFVQVLYNRLFPDAENDVFPFCEKHGLGILARVPLAKGFLSGSYRPGATFATDDVRSHYSQSFNDEQLALVERIKTHEVPAGQNMSQWALAWCLKKKAVSSVLVGCKSIEQLQLNAAASQAVL
jgi:aryl-alcohol dehydrogenase-like predicted oxidoreductase